MYATQSTMFMPLSSPPSSPSIAAVDSSPLSSPGTYPVVPSTPPPAEYDLIHPFAAAVKAKPGVSLAGPSHLKSPESDTFSEDDSFTQSSRRSRRTHYSRDHQTSHSTPEAVIWDEVINNAFDNGNGCIQLLNAGVTYIPTFISDLGKFFVPSEKVEAAIAVGSPYHSVANAQGGRVFSRVATAPARTLWSQRSSVAERSRSQGEISSVGTERHEVQLYLGQNRISRLPRELFEVKKITVLILRGNHLSHIPAEIANLVNLRELNISNNKIEYLPSEMLSMSIKILALHPNPYLQEAAARSSSITRLFTERWRAQMRADVNDNTLDRSSRSSRTISETTYMTGTEGSSVPPLTELCSRSLLSPHISLVNGATCTVLEALYSLPLDGIIADHVLRMLAGTVPNVLKQSDASSRTTTDGVDGYGVGRCPSLKHTSGNKSAHEGIFVKHMEERFTWESEIAGNRVGGRVPFKWRGCLRGCLDFLDNRINAEQDNSIRSPPRLETYNVLNNVDMRDSHVEDDMVGVQVVSLGPLDFDDEFDD